MTKVGLVINTMYGGGAERIVLFLLKNLNRNKFTPYLILFNKTGHYLNEIPKDVNVIELTSGSNILQSFRLSKELKNIIKKNNIDLLNVHLTRNNISILRASEFNDIIVPVIISEHNNFSVKTKESNIFYKWFLNNQVKLLYKKTKQIICSSYGIKRNIDKYVNLDNNKFSVIYNPVDIDFIKLSIKKPPCFIKSNDSFKIIAVGRLVKQKGFDLLIRAAADLIDKGRAINLYILGDGKEKSSLVNLSKELNINSRVFFTGFTENPWTEIHKADLFVLSSRWEGFGNVIIEAMASGTPVLATNCDFGPSEIIKDDYNGKLVESNSIKALVIGIEKMIDDHKKRSAYVKNSLKDISKYSIEKFVRKYESVFEAKHNC